MKLLHSCLWLVICLMALVPISTNAQEADETRIEFFSTQATMEDDPKKQNYNITIFSPDGEWKMQLNYTSESMFGDFGNEDFRLSGEGRYYNYVRNPKNDMVFYSFTDMAVSVADEGTLYRVKANCLTTNKKRFVVEATIEAPLPEVTLTDDLGFARVEANPFYGTYAIHAENERYKLSYGVVGDSLTGNFYRADMLMPELHDKTTGKDVTITYATAVHTQSGDSTLMTVDLLSDERVLYRLSMYNGPYDVTIEREEDITIAGATLQDVSEMYGCYIFAGANERYQLGVAIRPESVGDGRHEWTKDDLIMQYTRLFDVENNAYVPIYDVHASLEQADKALLLKADITSMDGTLYHATMILEQSGYIPAASDTVNIDFGRVGVLDFTHGIGTIGIGAYIPEKYQIRAYFNATKLEGTLTTDDFEIESCDVMDVYQNVYRFHDARYVNATMEKKDTRTYITIDMYCVNDVLYHATMYLDQLDCLAEDCTFPIDIDEGVSMVAIREGDDQYGEYTLQLQNLDNTFDDDYHVIGDGYFFSFYLSHEGKGIAGEYGYSAGTLADDEIHAFYEKGCEVRVAPVAGTLKVDPVQKLDIDFGPDFGIVSTYLYQISFDFVGQNASVYHGEGQNMLLCIDSDGEVIQLSEDNLQSINLQLADKGLRVRKVLKDGKIIIERADKTYDLNGIELK